MVNQLLMVGCVLYSTLIPVLFAFWDHFLPHADVEMIVRDEENKKTKQEYEAFVEEQAKEEGRREYREWCASQDAKWDLERKREEEERSRRWGEGRGGTSSGAFEGTCGPPDRDK